MNDPGADKDKIIHSIDLLNSQSSILINSKTLGSVIAKLSASGLMLAKEIDEDNYSSTSLLATMTLVAITLTEVTDMLIDSIIEGGNGIRELFNYDNDGDNDDYDD